MFFILVTLGILFFPSITLAALLFYFGHPVLGAIAAVCALFSIFGGKGDND